jgi:hypothetical protein
LRCGDKHTLLKLLQLTTHNTLMYASCLSNQQSATAAPTDANGTDDDELLPEDKFHLKLPPNVNKYTGLKEENAPDHTPGEPLPVLPTSISSTEDEVLPEDKFHQHDIVSQHMIDSREQQRQEKVCYCHSCFVLHTL